MISDDTAQNLISFLANPGKITARLPICRRSFIPVVLQAPNTFDFASKLKRPHLRKEKNLGFQAFWGPSMEACKAGWRSENKSPPAG
jgi:hypothetical protein